MELQEFAPSAASPDDWDRFHAFRAERHREHWPEDPLEPDEVMETRLRHPDPHRVRHLVVVRDGDRIVGEMHTSSAAPGSPEYATNRHLVEAGGWVLESHRRRGVGRGLAARAAAIMDRAGATVLTAGTDQESGRAFLERLGAEPKLRELVSRLDLRAVDWTMLERWIAAARERSPEARLEVYSHRLPDALWPEYCSAMTELLNTISFEELDHGMIVITPEGSRRWYRQLDRTGGAHHVCLVRDGDGAIVAVTDVLAFPHDRGYVRQQFTGVHPRVRGRGIGKWIKAEMLRDLRATHPDARWVTTENAGSNDPMLTINRALGFAPWRRTDYFQLARAQLPS